MHRQEDRKTKRYIDRKIDRHTGKKDLHSNEIDTEKGRQKQHEKTERQKKINYFNFHAKEIERQKKTLTDRKTDLNRFSEKDRET